MKRLAMIPLLVVAGCTHAQLARSTARTAATVMDIQYQMVMDNLAGLEAAPAALPSEIRIKQGTVQVSDEVGFYRLAASGTASGTFAGPRAERTVSEQWGADAITDPLALQQLQSLYRAALGLPPLEEPPILREAEARAAAGSNNKKTNGPPNDGVRIDLERDVPRGWFHIGTREQQVPGNAVYVSHHHGDAWVWVTPDGLGGLSRFTLLVLLVTKLGPGEKDGAGAGLMYTGGGR